MIIIRHGGGVSLRQKLFFNYKQFEVIGGKELAEKVKQIRSEQARKLLEQRRQAREHIESAVKDITERNKSLPSKDRLSGQALDQFRNSNLHRSNMNIRSSWNNQGVLEMDRKIISEINKSKYEEPFLSHEGFGSKFNIIELNGRNRTVSGVNKSQWIQVNRKTGKWEAAPTSTSTQVAPKQKTVDPEKLAREKQLELERQKAVEKSNEDLNKAVEEALQKGKETLHNGMAEINADKKRVEGNIKLGIAGLGAAGLAAGGAYALSRN